MAAVRSREEALRTLNPDDPQAAALFLEAAGGGDEQQQDLTQEEEGALLQRGGGGMDGGGGVGGVGKEGGLRMPARKRLVFSRLPSVLCFHLGRRVSYGWKVWWVEEWTRGTPPSPDVSDSNSESDRPYIYRPNMTPPNRCLAPRWGGWPRRGSAWSSPC